MSEDRYFVDDYVKVQMELRLRRRDFVGTERISDGAVAEHKRRIKSELVDQAGPLLADTFACFTGAEVSGVVVVDGTAFTVGLRVTEES